MAVGALTWDAALRVLPTAAAVLLAAVALMAAHGRRWWMATLVVCGLLAIASAGWQERRIEAGTHIPAARFADTDTKPAANPNQTAAERMLVADAVRIAQLQEKLARARQSEHGRAVAEPTAAALAQYLKKAGNFPVIVSCPPDDVEAFDYANQLVTILQDAGWDAHGPEMTRIFGAAPSMRVALYVNGPQLPPAAGILAEAFRKFDIPYESRVAPSDTVPAPGNVELYVPPKSAAADAMSGASAPAR